MPEVYVDVQILNLTYRVSGFRAISDLCEWLETNGEVYSNYPPPMLSETEATVTTDAMQNP